RRTVEVSAQSKGEGHERNRVWCDALLPPSPGGHCPLADVLAGGGGARLRAVAERRARRRDGRPRHSLGAVAEGTRAASRGGSGGSHHLELSGGTGPTPPRSPPTEARDAP